MNQKSETLGLSWPTLKRHGAVYKRPLALALGMLLLALTVATVLIVVPTLGRTVSAPTSLGIDAGSARWTALGVAYAPDYEAVAAVSSARWTALGEDYAPFQARAADAARWTALAARYPARYERSHAAGAARYQALAGHYGAGPAGSARGAAADAARWQALAAQYPAGYERSHAATSARYQALAEWYLFKAEQGE